jgi:hypothetical protein
MKEYPSDGKRQMITEAEVYLNNAAQYMENGAFEEAHNQFLIGLDILREVHGDCHPKIAYVLDKIGDSLLGLGKDKQALKYYLDCLQMRQAFYKDNHDEIISSFNIIGTLLLNLGRQEDALGYFARHLLMTTELYGYEDIKTANSLKLLGDAYRLANHYEMAFEKYQKSLILYMDNYLDSCPISSVINKLKKVLEKTTQPPDIKYIIDFYIEQFKHMPTDQSECLLAAIQLLDKYNRGIQNVELLNDVLFYLRASLELNRENNSNHSSEQKIDDKITITPYPLAYYLLVKMYLTNNVMLDAEIVLKEFSITTSNDKDPLTKLFLELTKKEYSYYIEQGIKKNTPWITRVNSNKEQEPFVQNL